MALDLGLGMRAGVQQHRSLGIPNRNITTENTRGVKGE